jgi:hypothetical protein
MTFAITIDKRWGGFYCGGGHRMWRICAGFIAINFFSSSLELYLRKLFGRIEFLEKAMAMLMSAVSGDKNALIPPKSS